MADYILTVQECNNLHTVDAISATLIPPLYQYENTTLYTGANSDTGSYDVVNSLSQSSQVIFGSYEYAIGFITSSWAYVRIPNVQIDQGASIKSAILKLTCAQNLSGTPLVVHIHANLEADSDSPTSEAEFLDIINTTQTPQFVSWSVGAWTLTTQYDSPDIARLIQSVVNLPSWEKGNAILLVINPHIGGNPDRWRRASAHSSGTEKPELYLEYSNNNSVHLHTADNVALTQKHMLTVQGADHEIRTFGSTECTAVAYPAVGGDDGTFRNYTGVYWFYSEGTNLTIGKYGHPFWSFIRFPSLLIPNGSKIDSAYVKFTAFQSDTGNVVYSNIYVNNSDNAVAPTDQATFEALSLTSAISWDSLPSWTDGTQYDTPDIATILQTVIDRPGWASGQAAQVVIKDDGSTNTIASRTPSAYEYASGSEKPELHVTFKSPDVKLNLHLAPQESAHLHTVDAIGTFKVAAVNATETLYPATQNDDGTDTNNTLTLDAASLIMGHYGGYSSSIFIRFDGVNIERLQQVQNAYVRFTAYGSMSGATCRLRIYAVDADDADAPTNDTEWDALTKTTAYVDWTPAAWTDDTTYDSPNIASVIQEVVNRAGWTGLSAIVIQVIDNSSDAGAYRRASSYDYNSGAQKPELHLAWISAGRWHTQTVDGDLVLVEHKDLVVAETYHSQAVDNISSMFVGINLTGASCDHLHTVDSVTIVVDLVVASCDHLHTVDDINQALVSVGVQAADHIHTVDGLLLLTQKHVLIAQGADHLQTSEGKIGVHIPAVAGADHLHTVDGITGTLIWVHPDHDEPYHIQTADNVALTQKHTLVVQETYHLHVPDAGYVWHLVVTQEAYHTQAVDNVALIQQHTLAVNDAYHLHVPDYGIKLKWAITVAESAKIWDIPKTSWIVTGTESITTTETIEFNVGWVISDYFTAEETITTLWVGTVTLEELVEIWGNAETTWLFTCTESVTGSETIVFETGYKVYDYLSASEDISTLWSGSVSVTSTLQALGTAILIEVFNETETESVKIADTDSVLHRMIDSVTSALKVSSEDLATQLICNPTITEAIGIVGALTFLRIWNLTDTESITATDSPVWQWQSSVEEEADFTDTASFGFLALFALTDNIALTESVLGSLQIDETLTDAFTFAATLAMQQSLGIAVEDGFYASLSVLLDDEVWETWVLNGSAFNASVYSGFEFNSYAVFNNTAYGCKSDGIYELTGTTDAGTAIKAGIVLPGTYFGMNNKKRFRAAYFGITSSGTPSIRMETDSGSATYTITDSKAEIGRNLYGRQWILKLEGFDTADFISLVPIVLAR